MFGIQKTVIAEYGNVLLMSEQNLNKDVKALIHSGHGEKNLYMQFRIGEKGGVTFSPESLVQLAVDCKSKLENIYNRAFQIIGHLKRCTEDIERIEF